MFKFLISMCVVVRMILNSIRLPILLNNGVSPKVPTLILQTKDIDDLLIKLYIYKI